MSAAMRASIEARARAIAVEQSVEMPLVGDRRRFRPSRRSSAGSRRSREQENGLFEVRIALAASHRRARSRGQLINMLFGNTSLHEDVVLHDVALPGELAHSVRRAAPWTA